MVESPENINKIYSFQETLKRFGPPMTVDEYISKQNWDVLYTSEERASIFHDYLSINYPSTHRWIKDLYSPTILDIGCSKGLFANNYSRILSNNSKITGIDIHPHHADWEKITRDNPSIIFLENSMFSIEDNPYINKENQLILALNNISLSWMYNTMPYHEIDKVVEIAAPFVFYTSQFLKKGGSLIVGTVDVVTAIMAFQKLSDGKIHAIDPVWSITHYDTVNYSQYAKRIAEEVNRYM